MGDCVLGVWAYGGENDQVVVPPEVLGEFDADVESAADQG